MKSWLHQCCPFPHIGKTGEVSQGLVIELPAFCVKRCRGKECSSPSELDFETLGIIKHAICPHGFSVYVGAGEFTKDVILCGLIDRDKNHSCSPQNKKRYRKNKTYTKQITAWFGAIERAQSEICGEEDTQVAEALLIFHDVRSAVSAVSNNITKCIKKKASSLSREDLDRLSDKNLLTAYRSSRLLVSQLNLSDIMVNPKSAAYSKPRMVHVYEMFDLYRWIFQEKARRRGLKIRLEGSSYNSPSLYDSFVLIPHALIDNAIKYSLENQEVVLTVRDIGGRTGVCVSIRSFGPIVPESERSRIFSRRFRGSNAEGFHRSGTGMGLWVAQKVAGAHGFTIQYTSAHKTTLNDLPSGDNVFSFEVHSI